MEDISLIHAVEQEGGVAGTAAILARFSPADLGRALAEGQLVRVARGLVALSGAEASAVAARTVSGVISGLSAAQWWGWALKHPPARPHVTVPRDRAVSRPGTDVRRQDLPHDGIVEDIVTSRAQTVIDCARTLPFDEALAVADSALREGRVDRDELLARALGSPRTGRQAALRVVRCADPRAANPFESVVRSVALDVTGLQVAPQVWIGDIGRADLGDSRLRIAVECESWAYHSGDAAFRRDIRRYTRMVCHGWLVVRFVWEDAMSRQDRISAALDAVVALRGVHS